MLFKFQCLLKITGNNCDVEYADDTLISNIVEQCDSSVTFVVRLSDLNNDIYSVNLSRIFQHMSIPTNILTIADFVNDYLTMSMLTSYHDSKFNMADKVQYLSEADIANNTTIQAYNLINGDTTDIFDSPSYPDLLINNDGLDLSHVYPVIDGLIHNQIIRNNGLVLRDGTIVLREAELEGFLYIPKASTSVLLSTISDDYIIAGSEFLLVLNGVWIPKSSGIYKVVGSYNRLEIDFNLLLNLDVFDEPLTQADIEANVNSFLIQFDSSLVMESCSEDIYEFYQSYESYHEYKHDNPSSTLMTTKKFRLVPLTRMRDRFKFKVLPRQYFRDDTYSDSNTDHLYWKVFI